MQKVFVGLSGGVDSSVAAALLQEEGYDVTGVFIKTWQPSYVHCTAREDRLDAMRVAAHLRIPFLTLDLEEEYKRGVADYMIAEYAKGRTPNPDAMCNREIKFGAFLRFAREQGADYIATGHYAERIYNQRTSLYELHRGADPKKDQAYFLYTLGQAELAHVLFPLGGMDKARVREKARQLGLPTAEKKDSQGICFLGEVDMKDFLARHIPVERGAVLDQEGKRIGTHGGAVLYTLGERHGFSVEASGSGERPLYVVGKDIAANTLTVAAEPALSEGRSRILLEDVRSVKGIPFPEEVLEAETRYHGERHPCRVEARKGGVYAVFSAPVLVSPGQSVVFYAGSECLGGGIAGN
ncbi:MAG TPA: tRNA 2-thiouridine(34) synthase MnmA [Candidatus Paceibacterota bacterium]|nr:tRNA 2-thiouridine(34) synthase MnmA [Candidatus Paceibacterota bacterium]